LGHREPVFRLGLSVFEVRKIALLPPLSEKIERFFARRRGLHRDLELAVEREEIDVRVRDERDGAQNDAAARLLRSQETGLRGSFARRILPQRSISQSADTFTSSIPP